MTLQPLPHVQSYDIMSATTSNISQDVTIRWALPADLPALERVAALDSKRLPAGPLLLAAGGGQIWAGPSTLDERAGAGPLVPNRGLFGVAPAPANPLRA